MFTQEGNLASSCILRGHRNVSVDAVVLLAIVAIFYLIIFILSYLILSNSIFCEKTTECTSASIINGLMIHKWFYFVYLMLKRNTMLVLNMKITK